MILSYEVWVVDLVMGWAWHACLGDLIIAVPIFDGFLLDALPHSDCSRAGAHGLKLS